MGHLWWGEKEDYMGMRCGPETYLLICVSLGVSSTHVPGKHNAFSQASLLFSSPISRGSFTAVSLIKNYPSMTLGKGLEMRRWRQNRTKSLCSCLVSGHSHGSACLVLLVTCKVGISLTRTPKKAQRGSEIYPKPHSY